jgi:uncharacterized SAM-binding protein YcdF (DUF218 family)
MKKIIVCLFVLAALLWLVVNYRPLLNGYAAFFNASNAVPGADVLVVLGGRIETRGPRALELYRQGYAPEILLTDLRPFSPGIPDFNCSERSIVRAMRDYFAPGAPLSVVPSRNGTGATSTFDEARDLLYYSREKGYTRIIIVTDEFHTRRSLYAFQKIFKDSGVIVESMGAPNAVFEAGNWWRSDAGLKAYLLEPMLLLVYFVTDANLAFLENH